MSDDPNSTARIRALARKGRRRLRWRHLLGVAAGLAVMTAALLTVVGRITGHDHGVTKLWPVALVAYLAGGLLATWALSRSKLDHVGRRLPVVLVLHIAGVALVALMSSGGRDGDGGGSTPRRGGRRRGRIDRAIDRAIDRVVDRLPRWRAPEVPDPRSENLACALLEGERLEGLFGGRPVGAPKPFGHWLLRARWMCECAPSSGKGTLQLAVWEASATARRKALSQFDGEPVAGLGDAALSDRYGLLVAAGSWLLVVRLLNLPLDAGTRASLIDVAAGVAAKLPDLDEPVADATDRELAHDAWGAVSRVLDA